MKTIITLTDTDGGGVNVQYMTQLTKGELERGMIPQQSRGYQCAMRIHELLEDAKTIAAEVRTMQAETAEHEPGAARCWH